MNKLIFDLISYQLLSIDMEQILVKGQKNAVALNLFFKQGDNFITDPLWGVYLTFERPDGSTSNEVLANLNNDHYIRTMTSWITDIAGELKVYVNLKANGVVKSFGIVKLVILDGANPSNDTITEAQYQLLLDNINNINNRLDTHINNKNNPHEVTRAQLGVYSTGEVDSKLDIITGDITDIQGDILGIKTDIDDIKPRLSAVEDVANNNKENIILLEYDKADRSELLNYAMKSFVVDKINEHNNDPKSHAYILNLLANIEVGNSEALVFDTTQDVIEWVEAQDIPYTFSNGTEILPIGLVIGQKIFTRSKEDEDYWVESIPVLSMDNLIGVHGDIDLSAYAKLTDLTNMENSIKTWVDDNFYDKLENDTLLNNKVDKVSGKGLSTNDFTNVLKDKLEGINDADVVKLNDINQLYGGKNLAVPDLKGKEYLGNGVYRHNFIADHNLTVDFDIYSGVYTLNKTVATFNVPAGEYYSDIFILATTGFTTVTKIMVENGSYNNGSTANIIRLGLGVGNFNTTTQTQSQTKDGATYNLGFAYKEETTFTNIKFKLQIEKGSTATPYTLPMVITPEYIRQTQTPRLIYSNSGTSGGTDIAFSYVDNTMKVGDVYKVHSQLTYDSGELTQREVNDLIISNTVNNNIEKNHYAKTQHSAITKVNYDYTTKTITMIGDFNAGDSSNSFNIRLYKVGY